MFKILVITTLDNYHMNGAAAGGVHQIVIGFDSEDAAKKAIYNITNSQRNASTGEKTRAISLF